jgi:hypothetical protein
MMTGRENMKKEKTFFACNRSALDKEQRERYAVLTKQLFSTKQEIKELSNGLAAKFEAHSQTIKDAAEFISL